MYIFENMVHHVCLNLFLIFGLRINLIGDYDMDEYFVETMVEKYHLDRNIDGGFSKTGWDKILVKIKMKEKFGPISTKKDENYSL